MGLHILLKFGGGWVLFTFSQGKVILFILKVAGKGKRTTLSSQYYKNIMLQLQKIIINNKFLGNNS